MLEEESHRQLLGAFFAEKRGAVDRYIEEVWVPTYSEEILKEPVIGTLWDQVCREGTQLDRLEFLRRIGPRIQVRINAQRQAMVEPLDEVERAIGERLRSEYDQARSVNNALTSFLSSASKVEANRERYLGMLGIRSPDIEEALGEADSAVGSLAHGTERVEDATQAVEAFRKRMEETRAKVRDALRGK